MASNGTASSSCLDPAAFKVTVTVVLTLLILITIAGNVVVCLAVGLNRRLRSLTNCFIVSLAITDLLLGLLVLPFSAFHQLSCQWGFGKVFCNIYTSLDVMLCTASILNLFMISLDRYCAVTDPLRYPVLVTPVRVAVSLVLIWVISITLSFLSIHLEWNGRPENLSDSHAVPKCKVQDRPGAGQEDPQRGPVEGSHAQGAQSHGDAGCRHGGLRRLLAALLHRVRLPGAAGGQRCRQDRGRRGPVAGLCQLGPEPRAVRRAQQGLPHGLPAALPLQPRRPRRPQDFAGVQQLSAGEASGPGTQVAGREAPEAPGVEWD